MTTILGTIRDTAGETVSGVMSLASLDDYADFSTSPDSLNTKARSDFTITDGAVNIDTPETETAGVSVKFSFTATGDTSPLFEFASIVPNVSSVELVSLYPTGVTVTTLDTGAYRIARNISNDSTLAQLLQTPSVATWSVSAASEAQSFLLPKPFTGGIRVESLSVLASTDDSDWTYGVSSIRSDGFPNALTLTQTSQSTANGLTHRLLTTTGVGTEESMGLQVTATPGAGAAALSATISVNFKEIRND